MQTLPDRADDVVSEGAEGKRINLRELTGCLTPDCSPKSPVSASAVCAESRAHGERALIVRASLCCY